MDDADRIQDYEKNANEYWRWVLAAEDLMIAADILTKEYKAGINELLNNNPSKIPLSSQILAQIVYLKAEALEIYLKALYIKQGNSVTKNGELIYRTHNLEQLYKNVIKNDLTKVDLSVLIKLKEAIEFWGRYPIPSNFRRWRPNQVNMEGLMPLYSWSELDNKIINNLLERIIKEIDMGSDQNLPF